MILMKNKVLILLLVLFSVQAFSKTIYSKYETTPEFSEFDKAMNQARFPTSDSERNEKNITDLESSIVKFSDYPEMSAAYFFMGHCNHKLENYRTSIENYKTAIELDSSLLKRTPVKRFIATLEPMVTRQNNILIALILFCPCVLIVAVLFIECVRQRLIGFRQILLLCIVVLITAVVTVLWFSISTSSTADGFKDLYVTPIFVRSTIFDIGAQPLIVLAVCVVFTSFITGLTTLVSVVLPRFRLLFSLIMAVFIGIAVSLLYYEYYALDGDRTGTGTLKRISFPERPIDFHKDIPDEMIYLYDEKVKGLIRKAKLEAQLEAASQK